jgi:hypothetical protein
MADEITGIRSMALGELLGAAMVAVVQADALAARATLEFVETVGFRAGALDGEGDESASPESLRMAAFRYRKQDETGQVAEFVAEVPILSLVSIPALQVKEAKFAFIAKIDGVAKTTPPTAPAPSAVAVAPTAVGIAQPALSLVSGVRPTATQLIARPAPSSGAKTEEIRSTHHLEVAVTLGQADVTVGLEKIFDLMSQAIQDRKAPQA